jgi:hypothetical protein
LVGLGFQSIFHETDEKIASLCPDHSKNVQFAVFMSEDLGHNAECAIHSCQTCLMLEHAYMQITLDCSQRTPTLRLRSNCGRLTRWLCTRDRAFFTPLPYQSVDCIWRWGNLLIQFTAKSTLSLCNGPYPNKDFHCIQTFSNAPTLHVN